MSMNRPGKVRKQVQSLSQVITIDLDRLPIEPPTGLTPNRLAETGMAHFEAALRSRILKVFFEHPEARKIVLRGGGFLTALAIGRSLGLPIRIEGRY